MFVIAVGDPFDGTELFGNDGVPFEDQDEAVETAEKHFSGQTWWVIQIEAIE